MFKLESYLTPLILNYVDKYIKNLKPEDSQFSLWGGDAVFSNLDLRLDVLEQELQLPFTFVNGHIHELRIHVPWTKLGSEPVIITINTIECILKLCGDDNGSECDSQKIIQSKRSFSSRHIKKPEITEAPPGYVQSLINRVISNICIICNNLILKYVEDDVVLSLNIKSVELLNVNEKWEKAFVDTNLTDTVVRKVIHMQDLTVCLDKRDASGKIETYQDPLLYRCSTTWRLYSLYNSPHSKYPTLTRIHMYCENLEFSLTDQQLPMFLRLLYLCVALQNRGTFRDKESVEIIEENSETVVNMSEENTDFVDIQTEEESWGSWAWSFIPEVPIWNTADSEEQEREANMLMAKKILQFGIFIGKASCTLKQTVVGQENIFCGSPKCVFVPLMILHFYGCSMEFTCKGKDFLNVQAGVSGATVTGLEDCVCGQQDFSTTDNERRVFLKSGVPPSSGHAYSYLSSSLFDPLAPENCGQTRKYCFNHDEHFATLTEEVMVQRFPAFAFDYLYELEIPDEWIDRLSTVTTLFLEESNWHENSICRLVFGPLCIDVTSSFVHRISKLVSSVKDYDYPSYTQQRKASVRNSDTVDDIVEQLEEFVPSRQYHLTLFKPVIRVFVADHSSSSKQETRKGKKKRTRPSKITKVDEPQFFLEIYADCIDLQASVPMYPSRLVTIANSHSSQVLLHHCYDSKSIKLFGLEVSLQKEGESIFSDLNIIQRASLTFFMKSLMLPEKWVNYNDLTQKEYSLECTNISLQLCEVRFLAAISIYHSWTIKYLNTSGLQKLKTAVLSSQAGPQQIFGEICDIKCSFQQSDKISFVRGSVESVTVQFQNQEKLSILFHAPELTHGVHKGANFKDEVVDNHDEETRKLNFLQLVLQMPEEMNMPPLFVLHISGSTFCLEPAFLSWLSVTSLPNFNLTTSIDEENFNASPTDIEDESTCSSLTQDASVSQTLTKSQSTVLVTNNNHEFHKRLEDILFKHSEFLSHLVLEVEIGSMCGLLPHSPWSLHHVKGSTTLQSWKKAAFNGFLNQAFVVSFPMFRMRNNSSATSFDEDIWQCVFPIRSFIEEKKGQDCFPWNLQIDSFSAYAVSKEENAMSFDYLLQPIAVSATIALSVKSDQNQMGLCIHMDSKFLGINLSAFQTVLLVDCIKSSSVFPNFAEKIKSWTSYFHLKPPDTSESNSINPDIYIQENIFPIQVKADAACDKISNEESVAKPKKLTLWSQLTLSKLNVTLFGKLLPESEYENFKVKFEVEEIISSLDIQDVYSKLKVKLTSLSANCFTSRSKMQEWLPGPFEGVVLSCNDMMSKSIKSSTASSTSTTQHSHVKTDNQPFLVATYTKALCSNAKEKWTSKQNSKDKMEGLEYISEIDIKLKSFDLILWMSLFDVTYQILIPFVKLYQSAYCSPLNIISEPKYPTGINFCSQNLPLLYIESSIIQLYLPENTVLINNYLVQSNENSKSVKEKSDDVLMLQVDCITLTSQVENPLPRIVLDAEVYNAALNSKSLSLPGAAVEDRQYQMDINGFALGSLSGKNMLWNKSSKKDLVLHHPLTMGENPALEWNIGVIPENRNISNDSVRISPIISPLNIRVAVAPAIVCDNSCKNDVQGKVIVAGISIEVSVTSDICLYLSINQSCFIYSLLKTNLKFLFDILCNDQSRLSVISFSQSLEDDIFEKQDLDEFPFVIPSCFTHISTSSCIQSCEIEKVDQFDFVPFEILVTASTVSVMFYYHEKCYDGSSDIVCCERIEQNQNFSNILDKYHHKQSKSQGIGGKASDNKNNHIHVSKNVYQPSCLHPFLCVSITQPHSYIMCRPSAQKFESSCFDLQLCGSSSDYIVEKPHESCTPVNDDFSLSYLETKPGEPNAKTGIPPSFFTVSCTDFFNYPASIKIHVERPVKFNFRAEIFDSTLSFIQCFQCELENIKKKLNDETEKNSLEVENVSDFSSELNLLKFFKKVHLYSTQVVIELFPSLDSSCEKLILTAGNFSMETGIETFKDEIKSFDLSMDMTGFTLQMYNSNQIWSFLQPFTFALHVMCHLNPWFQIELRFIGESMLFNLSFHHMLKLNHFIFKIQEQFQKQVERFKSIVVVKEKSEANLHENQGYTETKRRRYWIDDLRKGSFQFIQACEDHDSQPKAQEIVFNRASSNHPASMTWRYPEPRALIKIEVSPVPFQCEEGKSIKDRQVLTCYLQYWNSAQQEYLNLCDFMLSETEHCCLDLPDLNSDLLAVSDKWRVLLDCKSYIDDDGILETESPCLSPLALAACMSIDSCFDPSLIPVVQVQTAFELFKVSLYDYFDKRGDTPTLHPFEYDEESLQNQEFALFSFINPTFSCTKWSSKLKLACSSGITCEVLEYRNLTMLPLISPVDIICSGSVHFDKEKGPVYDVELLLHPCFFRITQSIIHTLTFSAYSIAKDLMDTEYNQPCSENILPNYYLICNNIQECIRFGQVDTEEYLILSPLKMHAYSWWCHKKKQMLRICFGSCRWKWSQEFSIDKIGMQAVMVDNTYTIIVKVKQLTNLQKQVIIDGQLIVHSELSFPIQLKCDFTNCSQLKPKGSNSFIIKSVAPESSIPTFLLPSDQCRNFKLSFTGVLDSQLWSEEISFNDNKLIKIPWKNSYQNVWCQVAHQKLDIDSVFIAVFVCPLFVLRSNLPLPLSVDVVPKNAEKYEVDLIGKGHEVKLLEGLEWDHKLELEFHPITEMNLSLPSVLLSVCDLSQVSLSSFDQNTSLEELCYKMQPMQNKTWPYCFLERICRPVTYLDTLYPCFEIHDGFTPAIATNGAYPSIKVDRSQCWTGLNTLLIDIKPHVMLVNRLQIDLYLFKEKELQWIIPPNAVAMPSNIHENFRLGIKMNEEYFYSSCLSVDESSSQSSTSAESNAFSFSMNSSQCLAQNGSMNILIKMKTSENKVCLFKLKSEVQEGIIVITAFPVVCVLNKTGKELYSALSFLPSYATDVTASDQFSDPFTLSSLEICQHLLFWNELPFRGSKSSKRLELIFYISLSIAEDPVLSYPICLHPGLLENNRHALSVPIKKDSKCTTLPLVVSSHKWEGMMLLVIDKDPSSVLLLHNQTNMNLFYGQAVSDVEGNSVFEELRNYKVIPMLQPGSSAHYTFPTMLEKFPFIVDKIPMLCLGAIGDDDKCIWSVPFKINIDKQFVHILGLCDFMIHCKQVGHSVYLYIDPVNRIELTAKEVRSRIALATNLSVPSVQSHSDTEQVKSKSHSSKKSIETKSKLTHFISKSITKDPLSSLVKVPFILYMNIRVVHISFILCDEFKETNKSSEVLRLNIDNAIFISRPKNDGMYYRLQEMVLCFEHIQIDNQMDNENNVVYDFPVILQRHTDSTTQNSEVEENNLFLPNKVKENSVFILNAIIELPFLDYNGLTVQSLYVQLLPVSLCIEDTFYYRIVNLIKSYAPIQFHKHNSPCYDVFFPKDVIDVFPTYLSPVHFQELKISIPEITLSLHASLKLYLSLENSVLKFQPFEKEDLYTSSYEIGRAFILHYLTGALFRAGWVVGSLDLLGNPAGFARAVGAGMSDFVYLPYKGLFRGPRAFISGLSSGAISLFTQISSGAIICMASLASSISRNMDFLCLDDEHLARQEILRHHLPQGISEGLLQGLSGLGLSLLSAIAGIADHPLQAIMSPTSPMKTASCIVSGIGKGIVGVFTKPIGGAAELLSQTGYGLLHGAGWLTPPKRQYQPVAMSLDVVSSSCLKYACKIAQCASLGEVYVSIEATYVNENGEYEKNILLLTSEALCILAEDEITLHRTFALSEIGCKKAESDQSTLVVIPSAIYRKQVFLESCDTVDRVVEYIKKNREENSCSSQDDFSDFLSKSTSSCHVFYLYPRDRSLFMTLFTFAKSKAMGKGFFTEC